MISFFRRLVGFIFPVIESKPFAISIFCPAIAVKALSYLGLIILLSACAGILSSGRSVRDKMAPRAWYSSCDKYLWTYKDMKPSMQTLVDQQLLVIPNEKRSYDLAPEDFNDQFKQIMQAYAQIPASATKPIVFSFTSMEALMAWTM